MKKSLFIVFLTFFAARCASEERTYSFNEADLQEIQDFATVDANLRAAGTFLGASFAAYIRAQNAGVLSGCVNPRKIARLGKIGRGAALAAFVPLALSIPSLWRLNFKTTSK